MQQQPSQDLALADPPQNTPSAKQRCIKNRHTGKVAADTRKRVSAVTHAHKSQKLGKAGPQSKRSGRGAGQQAAQGALHCTCSKGVTGCQNLARGLGKHQNTL